MNKVEIKLTHHHHSTELQSIKNHWSLNSTSLYKLFEAEVHHSIFNFTYFNLLSLLPLSIGRIPQDTPQSTQNKN